MSHTIKLWDKVVGHKLRKETRTAKKSFIFYEAWLIGTEAKK